MAIKKFIEEIGARNFERNFNALIEMTKNFNFLDTNEELLSFLEEYKKFQHNNLRIKPFSEYYPENTLEEIKVAISRLNERYQEILKRAYGENLEQIFSRNGWTKQEQSLLRSARIALGKTLKNPSYGKYKIKNLSEYYSENTLEEIKVAISRLNERYQDILKKAYGEDLEQILLRNGWTKQEQSLLYSARIALGKALKNPSYGKVKVKGKNLSEYYSENTLEEITIAISRLNERYQEILKRAYGEDLEQILLRDRWTKMEQSLLWRARIALGKVLKNSNYKLAVKQLSEYYPDNTLEEIKVAISRLNERYQEILKRAYGEDLEQILSRSGWTNQEQSSLYNARAALGKALKNPSYRKVKVKELSEYYPDNTLEEITIAVSRLNEGYQEILKRAYGEDLEQILLRDGWTNQEQSSLYSARTALGKALKNPSYGKVKVKGKKLSEYYPENNLEEITIAVSKLNERYQEILKRAYGEDLEQILSRRRWTKMEQSLLRRARNSLTKSFKNPNHKLTVKLLSEYYPKNTLEEIRVAISRLSEKHQEILKRAYGEDLEQILLRDGWTKQEQSLLCSARTALGKALKNPSYRKFKVKKLSEYCPENTLEEIRVAISRLSEKHQEILKRAYGEDFNQLFSRNDWTNQEQSSLYNARVALGKVLKNPGYRKSKVKKLSEYYPEQTLEEIRVAISKLNEKHQEILKRAYGEDFNQVLSRSDWTNQEQTLLLKARKELRDILILNYKNIAVIKLSENKNLYEMCSGYTRDEVDESLKFIFQSERDILLIFCGGNYENSSSYSNISPHMHKQLYTAFSHLITSLKRTRCEQKINNDLEAEEITDGLVRVKKFSLIKCFEKRKFTKLQILYFYSKLDDAQKEIILKTCGKTLEETNGIVYLNNRELKFLKETLKLLDKLLSENINSMNPIEIKVKFVSLYNQFPDYSQESVRFAINNMDSELINKMKEIVGGNLFQNRTIYISKKEYAFLTRVILTIKTRLRLNRNAKGNNATSMVALAKDTYKMSIPPKSAIFNFEQRMGISFGEAYELTKRLSSDDISLLKEAYGENYTEKLNSDLTDNQLIKLNGIFIHMKYLYYQNHKPTRFLATNKTLQEFLGIDQVSTIELVNTVLGESEIELLKISFGEKLSHRRNNSILLEYDTFMVNKIIGFLKAEVKKRKAQNEEDEYKLIHKPL